MNVEHQANNDFWIETGTREEMLEIMRAGSHVRYHAFKTLPVKEPKILHTKALTETMTQIGWNVATNNCVHQTYELLTTYGATLPNPTKSIKSLSETMVSPDRR